VRCVATRRCPERDADPNGCAKQHENSGFLVQLRRTRWATPPSFVAPMLAHAARSAGLHAIARRPASGHGASDRTSGAGCRKAATDTLFMAM
jgi:hypothetical protein